MAGWHHRLDGRESEWTLGVGDGQRGLACCDSWGHKELDTTEQLNWTEWKMTTKPEFPLNFDYFVFLAQWWANNLCGSNPACCLFSCGLWTRTEFYIFKYLKRNFQRIHFMTHEYCVKFKFQFFKYSLIGTQPCLLSYVCWVVAYVLQKQWWIVVAETLWLTKLRIFTFCFFLFFFFKQKKFADPSFMKMVLRGTLL